MNRYILSFEGEGQMPEEDLQLIYAETTVLDKDRQSLLVEPETPTALTQLTKELTDWTILEEKTIQLPSTQYSISDYYVD